jgi:hypothetical protein
MKNSSSTADRIFVTKATTAGSAQIDVPKRSVRLNIRVKTRKLENAVYAYIRALRALGRTQINTAEIADALSVPVNEVHNVVFSLRKKGVKKLNG